jgi:hypothetical protein
VLTVSAPSGINLGNAITPGSNISGFPLGTVSYQDSYGVTWSVTVAITDLCSSGCGYEIPFTNFSIGVGQSVSPSGPSPGTAGPNGLTGSDGSPGTTYSNPVTLANGTSAQTSPYSQSGNTITVSVPADMAGSPTMTSTIQYTITG